MENLSIFSFIHFVVMLFFQLTTFLSFFSAHRSNEGEKERARAREKGDENSKNNIGPARGGRKMLHTVSLRLID